MRTTKFRGLSIETPNKGEWTVGSLFHDLRDGMCSIWDEQALYWMRVDPATVGQFTGLIDKNGKEIFEGDVIEVIISSGEPLRHEVRHSDHYGGHIQARGIDECGLLNQHYISGCGKYIIGNIHSNPELLENE